jgi:hypothetical protein
MIETVKGLLERTLLMRSTFKALAAAATMAGAAMFASAPAKADGFGITFGPGGGVSFSVSSGGYCDEWGCPDDYWGYPVYYGPVFYHGRWYNGPIYYRYYGGNYWYWVHGGWRRDEWRGPRPGWWRGNYRYGSALSLDYYRSHGFHVRDNDWRRYRSWSRTHNWDRDHRDWGRGHDWNHNGNWDRGRDNDRHDWNRGDRTRFNSGEIRRDNREIRQDRRDVRGDWNDRRGDRNEVRGDTRELRQDMRQGAGTGEIRNDRREIRNDRQNLRQDRQETRGDRRELNQDRGERHRDRNDNDGGDNGHRHH